jgi:3-oxoacyl-[acyl-carrier-protein] synthase II
MIRAGITGIGVISALGPDRATFLSALREGRSGIRPLTLFPGDGQRTPWVGQAPDPHPPASVGSTRRRSRADLLALQAAAEALDDAGLSPAQRGDTALILGVGSGGAQLLGEYLAQLTRRGEARAPLAWLVPHQPASSTDVVAHRLHLEGLRFTLMSACSSSATALGIGRDLIRVGRARRVLAGGAEALCRLTVGGFSALRAMDDQPCRPFHVDRRGLTLGDGAAMLVLEELDEARARGAHVYAELAGYGVSADAHHLTAPPPDGHGAVAAMRAALRDAGVDPGDVQYINAHGTATTHNDAVEVAAIRTVFGAHADHLAVSSTKAMTGHALGAAGAIEAAACALAICERVIPPTLRLDHADPACDLDLVPLVPRAAELEVVLSNSFAFGGNNTSLVLRRVS